MKEVLMMYLPDCPYCHQANFFLDELMKENEDYKKIAIKKVDESVEVDFANSLDYYYVPTFYVDGEKLHEGVPTKEKVEAVLKAALEK